ncbi:hypothetical protein GCM10022204_36150 [Microlunatus aurantiacus]|uniref:Uncharacterized protein n=1 Tax=Microlunatus aurantiacus TaxID=446786 RepID=A0ABP7E3J2_9ACTN
MSSTIDDVLQDLRTTASSDADKGSTLEQLMAEFLRTDPICADQFENVYLLEPVAGSSSTPEEQRDE